MSGTRQRTAAADRRFAFVSSMGVDYRAEVEQLLFFNPRQSAVRARIVEVISLYGRPVLHEHGAMLRVSVGKLEHVQTLYVLDESKPEAPVLCGAMMFFRVPADALFVLHLAVRPAYAWAGRYGRALLVPRMVQELMRIARHIKGVKRLVLAYGKSLQELRIQEH